MSNITKTSWPLGWTPQFDAVNGDPAGLLRMDNLRLDKKGVLGLRDGDYKLIANLAAPVINLYSKVINGQLNVWYSENLITTAVVRSNPPFQNPVSLLTTGQGSPTNQCYFGDGLGQVLAIAGNLRTKDTGISAPQPLGLISPNPPNDVYQGPSGIVNNQQTLSIACPADAIEGTSPSLTILTNDPVSFEGQLATDPPFLIDTTNIGGRGPSANPNSDTIEWLFSIQNQSSSVISGVQLTFVLDGSPTDPSTWKNYYSLFFDNDYITAGSDQQFTMSQPRGAWVRYGNNMSLNWTTVIGVVFLFQATNSCTVGFSDINIIGGAYGNLNGTYNYIQVNVTDNGVYLAKSPPSTPFVNLTGNGPQPIDFSVINGSVTLYPWVTDPNVTHAWFFRISSSDLGINPATGQSLNASSLGQYYYVGQLAIPAGFLSNNIDYANISFLDTLSDDDVLQLNIDGSLLPNLFLQSLNVADQTTNYFTGNSVALNDTIFYIEGMFGQRMLYMGASFIYLSDLLNPDAVDTRYTLKPSGNTNETNLWIKKLTNNVLILGTTKDLYEITGTLNPNPDGTVDVQIIPMGEKYPPISQDVVNYNGALYYIAADGVRATSGSNSNNISPQLRHLFDTSFIIKSSASLVSRHGVPGVSTYNGQNYSIAIAHERLYVLVPLVDSTRRIFVYDMSPNPSQLGIQQAQYWSLMYTDPIKLWSTQTGELLAAYGVDAGNSIWILDYAAGYGSNNAAGLPFTFRTVFDADQKPRNRKDTFTLKLIMDTGGTNVSVAIQKDGIGITETDETTWQSLGLFGNASDGLTTFYIPLSAVAVTLGFRYAVQITGTCFTFKLYEMTIEYQERPEQLNYLSILPSNLGTYSRKRVTAFAYVIDTLGNPTTFTPNSDLGLIGNADSFLTNGKTTHISFFANEVIVTDIGGVLSGGPFEFYGVNLEETVSEKLPVPCTYFVIPPSNYGTPNRKRHTSYKFQILTRGYPVTFQPTIDGVLAGVATTYKTSVKQTVDYYFPAGDVIGTDIGGILQSAAAPQVPFEFYGVVVPQKVETLPERLTYYVMNNQNLGVAAPKRFRTLPIVIDTHNFGVNFTPIIDGAPQAQQTLTTNGKLTTYYLFSVDAFGTDIGGIFASVPDSGGTSHYFEFYELGTPEDVEILPVPKCYDMVGPMRFDKIGKIFGMRVRIIMNGQTQTMPYSLYGEQSPVGYGQVLGNPLFSGSFPVFSGFDNTYEIQFPKSINSNIVRVALGPTADTFHRYDIWMKVHISGMPGEAKWQQFR